MEIPLARKPEVRSKIQLFARIGYAARGAVYFLMGLFALLLATGSSEGKATDSKGAIRELLDHRFGTAFLIVMAVGLFSYAIWRLYETFADPTHEGTKAKGLMKRAGFLLGAIGHASLGIYALNLIFYFSQSKGGTEQSFAHKLLTLPFGQLLTAAIGIGIIVFGLSQFFVAIKEKFCRTLDIPADKRDVVVPVCKFGLMARGAVFALIGWFFVQAALHYSSREAGGIAQAWQVLREQPFGNYLIGVVALGFLSFGVYGAAESLYDRTPERV